MRKNKMMTKNLAKYLVIGVACILGVCGCGKVIDSPDQPDGGEIEGADWRTWGIIDAYGTLTADGTDTDVCVCLFADRAELYYDEESQSLYTTVEFPEKLSDEEYQKLSMEISDYTGDGNSDIAFIVGEEDSVTRRFAYIYDQGDFVYDAASAFNFADSDEAADESGAEEGNAQVDFGGTYVEPNVGRCTIEINMERDESYSIFVSWSSGAATSSNWAITGATYGETGNELVYSDAIFYLRTYDEEGNYVDEDIYDNGSGRFYMTEGGMLGWESDNSDVDGIDGQTLYERLEQ